MITKYLITAEIDTVAIVIELAKGFRVNESNPEFMAALQQLQSKLLQDLVESADS